MSKKCLEGKDVSKKLEQAVFKLDKRIPEMILEAKKFLNDNFNYQESNIKYYIKKLESVSRLLQSQKGLKIYCSSPNWINNGNAGAMAYFAYFGFKAIYIDKEVIIQNKATHLAALILHESSH